MTGASPAAFLFAALLAAGGCSAADAPAAANQSAKRGGSEPAAPPPKAAGSKLSWDATRCGDDDYKNARMERHPELMGLAPEPLEAAFGAPAQREEFRVGEPAGTFYGELGRRQGSPAANAGAPARAITWTKSGCNFSVFFVKTADRWQAVNAFEWAAGADF